MITHGTQEITDLRRGTWRITSMTRGTFDILYKFSSPYSTAATRALMAAFPTKWEEIKQYGFDNPWVAPYVNEDYLIVCSLGIEGLPIRWLECSNVRFAPFETLDSTFEIEHTMDTTATRRLYMSYGYIFITGYSVDRGYESENIGVSGSDDKNEVWVLRNRAGYLNIPKVLGTVITHTATNVKVNGVSKISFSANFDYTKFEYIKIGCTYPYSTVLVRKGGEEIMRMIPYIKDGSPIYICIDKDGTVRENQATSTYGEIYYTLPDGTPWTPPAS